MNELSAIFGSHPPLAAAQECARAILIFAFGLTMVRLAGRRVFGKWSALDTIVSVIVGSNLSRAITGSAPLWGTLAATAALFALHWILSQAAARWAFASHVLEGSPIVLKDSGDVDHGARRSIAISEADLNEALRQNGLATTQGAERVTVEPSGRITVLKAGSG